MTRRRGDKVNLNGLRGLSAAGVALVLVLLGGLLFATPAPAALQYQLLGKIPGVNEADGLGEIAVNGTSASVIVNRDREVLKAFGLTGEVEWAGNNYSLGGLAVNEGTGEIYVGNHPAPETGVVTVLSSAGMLLFEINGKGGGKPVPKGLDDPKAIAVDQATGEVYVYDREREVIDVFAATGEYLYQITSANGTPFNRYVAGLAVDDATGELLVGYTQQSAVNSLVYVFSAATGAYVTAWNGANTPQKELSGSLPLAVDNVTGEVYVATGDAVVDRFTATGEYESQIKQLGPQGVSASGVSVDSATGDVYVLGWGVFAANPVAVPSVSLVSPSSVKPTSVTLHGLVNPENTGDAICEFEYGTTLAYGQRVPCTGNVASGNTAVPVEAQLSGLKSDTTYYYRLDAKNLTDGYTNTGEGSEDLGSLTTPGPKLVAEGVSAVTAESASFEATVVPNSLPSSAYFQYGTTEAYGTSLPTAPGIILGAGTGEVEFSRHIQGLMPGMVYHYRLVVLSELEPGNIEEVNGPDHTFTTQPVAAGFVLPDGREWELVTPAEKHGALFFGQNYTSLTGVNPDPLVGEASVNGDAMIDLASAPTEAEPYGYIKEVSVLSTRGAGGWSSQVIAPPRKSAAGPYLSFGGEYEFFSEDLSRGVLDPFGPFTALSPEASEPTPYLHTDYLNGNVSEHCGSSCDQPLATGADTQSGVRFGGEAEPGAGCPSAICGPAFVAGTPDASHIALSSLVQLTATPNERAGNELEGHNGPFYYEWGDGKLQPLYLLPENEGGEGVYAGVLSSARHQLSDDGSVFFVYKEHLYLHNFAKGNSVRLDIAQGGAEPVSGGASFLYASSDGSRVLFSDTQHLTSAAQGGVYECRIVEAGGVPACELELTSLSTDTFIGGSKDASYLYFEDATGHLVIDHYSGGEWATVTGPYVGTWPASASSINIIGFGDGAPMSDVSPDGRWLTFMSEEELTDYDNHDAISGRPDVEVYLYDATSNRLVCASCNPTGGRPVGVEYGETQLVAGSLAGKVNGGVPRWVASNLPPWVKSTWTEYRYQPHFLSDGGRLFFDSRDALVPQDVNGAQDVYEWESPGVGGCTTGSAGFNEHSGGCVSLISSGASAEESAFMDASGSGGDVFFITLSKLTSQDFDGALDVYDAHECSAQSPCMAPAVSGPPACSTGDSCKAAPTPQPSIFGAPSSATFSGAGNVIPPGAPVAKGPKRKQLSRSQKLAQALRVCAKKRRIGRAVCERVAHRRYGRVANRGKRG